MKEVTHLYDDNKVRQHSQQDENNSKLYNSQAKVGWFLKARLVADRDNGQDVFSPTVSTKSLFLLAVLYSLRNWNIRLVR